MLARGAVYWIPIMFTWKHFDIVINSNKTSFTVNFPPDRSVSMQPDDLCGFSFSSLAVHHGRALDSFGNEQIVKKNPHPPQLFFANIWLTFQTDDDVECKESSRVHLNSIDSESLHRDNSNYVSSALSLHSSRKGNHAVLHTCHTFTLPLDTSFYSVLYSTFA